MRKLLLIIAISCAFASSNFAQSAGLSVVTVSSGSTPTLTTTAGFTTFIWTLTGNVTSSTFSSAAVGAGSLILCEDSTGGRTVVLPTNFQNFTPLQSTALNYCQYYVWEYDGTNVTAISDSAIQAADLPAALSSSTSVNGTTIPSGGVTLTQTICSGTQALGTTLMTTGTKFGTSSSAVLAVTCTGMTTGDTVSWTFASDPSGVTGYGPSATGSLSVVGFQDGANTIGFWQYNNTASSITPGAMTLNYRVTR